MTQHDFSRRDFLLRTGQYGLALSIFGPGLGRGLLASPVHAPLTAAARDQALASAVADDIAPVLSGLSWRMLGPFRGGRVDAVSGVPGRPNEFYFGAVNGGVWKTIDGGRVWNPVFDSQPVASIGAIAVAPSAPNTVYVGTGESTLRDSMGYGDGMYKSTDAGKTWTHIGLADTQHIGKIAVDPKNANVVFVAAIGHLYAPNAERGVFRSRDGGRTWKKVLGTNDLGAVEVVIDPSDSKVVYAGLWNTRRPPWFVYRPSNGVGGGIYKSTDGGNTWKQLTSGLPTGVIGRSGIAVAPTNPRRVYAVVDCLDPDPHAPPPPPASGPGAAFGTAPEGQGGFFRSDDGGANWTKMSNDPALWGRGWYFEKLTVDPRNADIVYVPNVAVNRTMDGGKTWVALRGSPGGDDYHQFWVSPDDPDTAIVASDQGAVITRNARAADPREVTWSSWLNQATAQIYHISVDYRTPYWVTGAQQDSGAVAVRSRGKFAEISMRDWEPIGAGGESGYTAGDKLNPGIIFGGTGQRWDLAQNIALPGTTPQVPQGVVARTDWTQPLVFSKADPNALYYANQYLFKSGDHARTWTAISGDLTRENPVIPPTLDKTAADDFDAQRGRGGVIFTIGPSPMSAPMVWVGTDDGRIWLTTNDGKDWADVTPGALAPWDRVTMIEASHFDVASAYASVDRHQLQDFRPYIYRTRDNGKTWQTITRGLPAEGYVHVVREDPSRRGLLFAGTERGAFVSLDDGDNWQPLQMNLPVTSVRDFEVYGNDLIVGTFGRGIYVIDDISPLRQVNERVLASDAYLFKPADTTYYVEGGDNGTPLQKDEPQAPNPPNGVAIDYYIKSAAAGPVTLEVVDPSGKVLRTWSNGPAVPAAGQRRGRAARPGGIPNVSPLWQQTPQPFATSAGTHRVVWSPVANDRGAGVFGRQPTPLAGSFTARLIVGGQTYLQTFEVKPDPRAAGEPK